MIKSELKSATKEGEAITVSDVASYLEAVRKISKKGTILYRGHAQESWKLQPSVGREKKFWKNEKSIFLDFKRQYHLYADDRPSTDIDILFLAQHFGLPTRLLDWTYNPLVALWMACQEAPQESGCIYTIKVNKNNVLKEGKQLNFNIFSQKEKDYLLIVPDYTNRRYLNQKGMFLWFKNPAAELTGLEPSFTIQNKGEILQELAELGINNAFIYPTLEKLSIDIKDKYLK